MNHLLKYSLMGLVLTLAASTSAHAHGWGWVPPRWEPLPAPKPHVAPEVDPSLAISGIALLAGTLAVARSKRASR